MSAVLTDELTPGWVRDMTHPVLVDLFGTTTVRRGATYQRNRAVRNLMRGPGGASVMATVQGGRQYSTVVASETLGQDAGLSDGADFEVVSDCTCPMGDSCKHVVAVILEAQAQVRHTPTVPPMPGGRAEPRSATRSAPPWEALLAPIVRGPETARQSAVGMTPLGLLVDVSGSSARHTAASGQGSTLQLRPLMPGATGGWIRTGISWSDLAYPRNWRRIVKGQWEMPGGGRGTCPLTVVGSAR